VVASPQSEEAISTLALLLAMTHSNPATAGLFGDGDGDVEGAVLVGGGSTGDIGDATAQPFGDGQTWHVRGVLGTRSVVAGEVAYVGSLDQTASSEPFVGTPSVLSNGLDLAARFQLPITPGGDDGPLVAPFVAAGVGTQLNDTIDPDLDTIALTDEQLGNDPTLHVPMSAGLTVGGGGILVDARVGYRPAVGDLELATSDDRFYDGHNALSVTASLGVEI